MIRLATHRESSLPCPDPQSFHDQVLSLEWLETDGRGGYAASTLSQAHSRRYHGMLCVPLPTFGQRHVLISKVAPRLVLPSGDRCELDSNQFDGGRTISPNGLPHLEEFCLHNAPRWRYRLPDGSAFTVELMMIRGSSVTLLSYRWDAGNASVNTAGCTLELAPFLSCRDIHTVTRQNNSVQTEPIWNLAKETLFLKPYPGYPSFSIVAPSPAIWHARPEWWNRFYLARDVERGFADSEDLFTPGFFSVPLVSGQEFVLALCAPGETPAFAPQELVERERTRRHQQFGSSRRTALRRAAEQFLTRDQNGAPGIVAGYPWFERWGRDTLIALPHLAATLEASSEERSVLEYQLSLAERGLIPNLITASGERLFNSIDAVLWLFEACHRYAQRCDDQQWFKVSALPILRTIAAELQRGTSFGIHVTANGLLTGGNAQTQLTWMDAKVHSAPVTPRHGAAVEINALWFNALRILAYYEQSDGARLEWSALARATQRTFLAVFPHSEYGLKDTESGPGVQELRPNQLIALALSFPVIEEQSLAERILHATREQLLTPRGLRTLAPTHPAFCPRYQGSPQERDSAYHQGTVWPWLLLPYAQAINRAGVRFQGELEQLSALAPLFLKEGCIGSVAEVYDGTEPQRPGGCFAQAWSVAALCYLQR